MNAPPASANAPADTSAKFPLQFRICARLIFSIKEKEILPRCSALKDSGGRGGIRIEKQILLSSNHGKRLFEMAQKERKVA